MEELRFARSGIVAGVVAVVGFTVVHDLMISDIWAMLPIMAVAGAICGGCLGWSYGLLVPTPSAASWLAYATTYLLMFGLLGALSVVVFEPVTTMAAILARGGPIDDLIVQALPMTVAFTLGTAVLIGLRYRAGIERILAVLVTTAVLVLFLGLNISAIGLVAFSAGEAILVAELLALVAVIGGLFMLAVLALESRTLLDRGARRREPTGDGSGGRTA